MRNEVSSAAPLSPGWEVRRLVRRSSAIGAKVKPANSPLVPSKMRTRSGPVLKVLVAVAVLTAVTAASTSAQPPPVGVAGSLRLHGVVEPVRSHPVAAPRLTGTPFQLVIITLAKGGSRVKRGDLLVE